MQPDVDADQSVRIDLVSSSADDCVWLQCVLLVVMPESTITGL